MKGGLGVRRSMRGEAANKITVSGTLTAAIPRGRLAWVSGGSRGGRQTRGAKKYEWQSSKQDHDIRDVDCSHTWGKACMGTRRGRWALRRRPMPLRASTRVSSHCFCSLLRL